MIHPNAKIRPPLVQNIFLGAIKHISIIIHVCEQQIGPLDRCRIDIDDRTRRLRIGSALSRFTSAWKVSAYMVYP